MRCDACVYKDDAVWCIVAMPRRCRVGRMCFWLFSRCVGRAEQCVQFCVRSSSGACCWAGNSAQFAGAVHLAGVAREAPNKWIRIYHSSCAAHFHESFGVGWSGQWECGGEGFWLVGGCTRTLRMCCLLCLFICTRRSHLCHLAFFSGF